MLRILSLLCLASLLTEATSAAEPVKHVPLQFKSMPSISGIGPVGLVAGQVRPYPWQKAAPDHHDVRNGQEHLTRLPRHLPERQPRRGEKLEQTDRHPVPQTISPG